MSEENLMSFVTRRAFIRNLAIGAGALALPQAVTGRAFAAGASELVWGKKIEATMYDPATSILASSWELLHTIYEGLVDLDADLKPVPGVAESWTQPSPAEYVFTIRKGVKFSNGRELTVDDVVGSLTRLINPKTGSFFGGQMGPITAIEAAGDNKVRIALKTPYAPLLTALSSTMASILPMKELAAGGFDPSKAFLGSGPYMVESHTQGDKWVLARNPNYWRQGQPTFDRLVVRIIPNDNALIAALRDGSVQVAQFDASPDAKLLLGAVKNVEIVQNQQSNLFWLMLNAVAPNSPFGHAKVRQAVALAVDRPRIAKIAMGGNGAPSSSMAPLFAACDTSKLGYFNRDVNRAKSLLAEAGQKSLSFELITGAEPAWQAISQVLKESFAEAGITVNIVTVDEGTMVKRVWIDQPGNFQAALGWYAGYSDPAMIPLWFVPKAAGFTGGYQIEEADVVTAVTNLRAMAADDPARPKALQDVASMLDAQANQIPLITRVETMAFRADLVDASGIRHKDGYADNLYGVGAYKAR